MASGWAYNAGLKRTPASVAGLRVGLRGPARRRGRRRPGHTRRPPGGWSPPGAALGAAAHLANVAPDLEDDLATGVRGLPHRMGARAVGGRRRAAAGRRLRSLLVLGPEGPPTTAGWVGLALALPAVVVAALAGTARFRRAAFPAVMLLTVLDVLLLLAGGAALT